MKTEIMHPADQLVHIINRIYSEGMTTTSGGNLSILDENGDIWITPSGVDKGSLTRKDICRVRPDGTVIGLHKPSVEMPFHASIYRKRPDLRAVLHAHSPALVAFSVTRTLPDTNLTANASRICGKLALAEYAVLGSKTLGDNISRKFEQGFDIVVLENHGVVVGSTDMFDAFKKFETTEALARLEVFARKLGGLTPLTAANTGGTRSHIDMEDFLAAGHSREELEKRRDIIKFIRRSYSQRLFGSTHGTYSARLTDGSFLITPHGADRAYIDEADLVQIKNGMKERGKTPSHSVGLHKAIYDKQPEINCVIGANLPHAMAFAVTGAEFNTGTIPESYLMLREIKKVPYGLTYHEPEKVAGMLSNKIPALICENEQILVTGSSLLRAFDRLEVAEATARSILSAMDIGRIVNITAPELKEIDKAFKLG